MKLTHFLYNSCLLLAFPYSILAQHIPPGTYEEQPRDAFIDVPRASARTSQPYGVDGTKFKTRQVNVDADGQNFIGDAANEPSIVIDPTNPLRMAIGWRHFSSVTSDFRQAGYAFSLDGGEHWNFPGPIDSGVFRSDPVLDTDVDGNFFYNSLTMNAGIFSCKVYKSIAGTDTWDNGVLAFGGDKQWMVIDKTTGTTEGNIYSCWRKFISSCSPGSFTRSLNDNESYDECTELPDDPARGTMAIGVNGEVYACGSKGQDFVVMKSSNAGDATATVAWDYSITVDMGGQHALYDGPNPSGMLGQPWIAVDHSAGATHGFMYLLAPIVNAETGDPADITFSRSTDGGLTWSPPIRIHDDASGNWQWFGSMSLAPNGRIDVTWLDTRDHPDTYLSALWYTYSLDGGLTWSAGEALSDVFDPHLGFPQQNKIGDYYQQLSDAKGVHLAWAATFNGEEDIYYSYIEPELEPSTAVKNMANEAAISAFVSPAVFSSSTTFRYTVRATANIRLTIFNAQGQLVEIPILEEKGAGDYVFLWSPHVASGLYCYQFTADGVVMGTGKMVKQ
jgi:hypothetical protein